MLTVGLRGSKPAASRRIAERGEKADERAGATRVALTGTDTGGNVRRLFGAPRPASEPHLPS